MKKVIKRGIFILVVAAAICVAGPVLAKEKVTLMLDWFPNIDHLPIYVAQQAGYFDEAGLDVRILSPSETTDALKLAAANKVDIAVSYAPQSIMGAAEGLRIRVIGRLVEHPLSVLLFLEGKGIDKPADLEQKNIGYTVPGMMDILLDAFAKLNGIEEYQPINVGFSIVQSLVSGKVDAIMGPYKNYETVELAEKGYRAAYFELGEWGIPDYDELVFISGEQAVEKRGPVLKAFVSAVARGIERTRENHQAALEMYFAAVPEAPRDMETKAFRITLPLYAGNQALDVSRWQTFADFADKYGLIERPVTVDGMLVNWH